MGEVIRFMDRTHDALIVYKITTPTIEVKLEESIESQYKKFSSSKRILLILIKRKGVLD